MALAALVLPAGQAQAQEPSAAQGMEGWVEGSTAEDLRESYPLRAASAAIEVDGRLDDPGWSGGTVVPLPFEVQPAENAPAPVATECHLTYDSEHLYLGCRAWDPRAQDIRAYVTDRDAIEGHDRILLTLDPFNDRRRAFQFGISALGVQYDAVLAQQGTSNPNQGPDGLPVDPSWDAIWSSAGRITEDGYVVEAAIPFASLRFPSTEGPASWGFFLTRWWPRSSRVEIRSARWDRGDSCLLCQANTLTGLRGVTPGSGVQVAPTLTTSRSDGLADFPDGEMVAGPTDPEVGVNARWGITSNISLNLAVNPDFSQVEADVAQLDVNSRFALFFPEKRPFFLEGADFFGTPINAVFTRSISDPSLGAKLTGKVGGSAVGLLMARDQASNLIIPGSHGSARTTLGEPVNTAVARFRRDVGGTSTVGALYTHREAAGYHNRLGGVDAFYRPADPLTLQLQYLRSDTEYPTDVAETFDQPGDAFQGGAVQFLGNWSTRDWAVNSAARRIDEGFRADAGFAPQAGLWGAHVNVVRRFWGGEDSWYTQIRLQGGRWINQGLDGRQIDGGYWAGLQYTGPSQSSLSVWPNFGMREDFGGKVFRDMTLIYFNARVRPAGSVSVGLNGDVGDVVDYTNVRRSHQLRLSPRVDLRLGRNVELRLQHTHQRLSWQGRRVFTADLSQIRGVYNFSPRSFVRAIVQLRQTDRDPGLYALDVDRRSRSLFTQLLYSYKVNPQTVLFAGYSDDRRGLIGPEGSQVPLIQTGRTFFLKVGYAWRP